MLVCTVWSVGASWPTSAHLGRHDDVRCVVYRRVGAVARVEATSRALHDVTVGLGEVFLRRGCGYAELALVAPARELAVFVPRPAIIALAAVAFDVRVALARFKSFALVLDGLKANLAALELGRNVQFGSSAHRL